jgi:hypothetical protein
MAVTKFNNLGEVVTNFMLNDFDLYIMNTSATGNYVSTDWAKVGYTDPEKEITPIQEMYTREDKIPRIPTYQKTIRIGMEMKFGLSNQNAEFEAMISKGVISTSASGTRIAHGTKQADTEYRAVRLVCERDDSVNYAITIPKCEITLDGSKTYGGETEVVTPMLLKAFYNAGAGVSSTANLYYEDYLVSGVSPTADVPDGFN